jgi:hypothetical protein
MRSDVKKVKNQESKGKRQKCFDPPNLRKDERYERRQNAVAVALLTFDFCLLTFDLPFSLRNP